MIQTKKRVKMARTKEQSKTTKNNSGQRVRSIKKKQAKGRAPRSKVSQAGKYCKNDNALKTSKIKPHATRKFLSIVSYLHVHTGTFTCKSPIVALFRLQFRVLADGIKKMEILNKETAIPASFYARVDGLLALLNNQCLNYNYKNAYEFDMKRYEFGVENIIISPIDEAASDALIATLQLIHKIAALQARRGIDKIDNVCKLLFLTYQRLLRCSFLSVIIKFNPSHWEGIFKKSWELETKSDSHLLYWVEQYLLSEAKRLPIVNEGPRNAQYILRIFPRHHHHCQYGNNLLPTDNDIRFNSSRGLDSPNSITSLDSCISRM